MLPSMWYLGQAPSSMVWAFVIIGGFSWFPGVDPETLVAVPFVFIISQIVGYILIQLFAKQMAPLFEHIGILICAALLSSVGVCGICFIELGLLDSLWLYSSLFLGAVMAVPQQQAWIEFYTTIERRESILSHTGASLLALCLAVAIMGIIAPTLPILVTFVLVVSGLLSLIIGSQVWPKPRKQTVPEQRFISNKITELKIPPIQAKTQYQEGKNRIVGNTSSMMIVEVVMGVAFGIALNQAVSPSTLAFALPLCLIIIALPPIFLLFTVMRAEKLFLYRTSWPIPLIMTCAYLLLGIPLLKTLSALVAQGAYMYFGLFFSAFCLNLTLDSSPVRRLRTINGGSLIGASGVAFGCILGILAHRAGIFMDERFAVVELVVVVFVNLAWAYLLGDRRHESELGLSPQTVFVAKETFSATVCESITKTYRLTEGEKQILICMVRKEAPKSIAHERNVSVSTVRSQIKSIYAKTGVHSSQELIELVWLDQQD